MQKNNLCPLPNKVLVYEEIDTISQSIFNSKVPNKKNINKNKPIHKRNNIFTKNYNITRNIINNYTYSKFQKYFEKNYNIFLGNVLLKTFNIDSINKKAYLISNYYNIKESKIIFPKREFYYRHHIEFLERPNLISVYFNKIEKEYSQDRLNEYRNQKKKENSIKKKEENNQKIFDTNVLEEIENYSTTITQASNNEKFATITPSEIFRRCEDDKKLSQKIKNNNEIINEKDKDEKSKLTFSESCISYCSKNVPDESLITVINGLSNKPKKYKPEEKKLITFFNKKKEEMQKITKFNKINSNQRINGINKFIKKETKKEKRISNSNNKKNKKLVVYDITNQNLIKKISSNSKKKSNNMNYPSFNLINKRKEVFNLKRKSFKKKRNTIQYMDNTKNKYKNNLVSISINNIDDLLNIFLTPENKNKFREKAQIPKKQNKKNSALTNVNNIFDINNKKNSQSQSQKKFKKIKKENKLYKSKSPLTRLFNTGNKEKSEESKNYKKRKSVLISQQNNNLLVKSMNFTNRRNYLYRNKKRQNNAVTLSQNFDSIMKNLLK